MKMRRTRWDRWMLKWWVFRIILRELFRARTFHLDLEYGMIHTPREDGWWDVTYDGTFTITLTGNKRAATQETV